MAKRGRGGSGAEAIVGIIIGIILIIIYFYLYMQTVHH